MSKLSSQDRNVAPARLAMAGVSMRFGQQIAINNMNLSIAAGEIVALLGPNGAGKSTTLALAMGFLTPHTGHIEVNGLNVGKHLEQVRRSIGYIPEQVRLYPSLTGLENLAYFSALAGSAPPRAQLVEQLSRLGIDPATQQRRTASYSKGMCQKIAIAIAQAKASTLLLFDEPSSGLDPKAALDLNAIIRQAANQGAGILMATHDLLRAREVAHRVVVLNAGRILFNQPLSAFNSTDLEHIYLDVLASEYP